MRPQRDARLLTTTVVVVWVGSAVQARLSHCRSQPTLSLFIDFPYMASVVLGRAARLDRRAAPQLERPHPQRAADDRGRVCWFTQHTDAHARTLWSTLIQAAAFVRQNRKNICRQKFPEPRLHTDGLPRPLKETRCILHRYIVLSWSRG